VYATAANNRKVIQDIDCNIQHTEICPYNETYDGILFKSVFYRKSDAILSVWSAFQDYVLHCVSKKTGTLFVFAITLSTGSQFA